MDNAFAGSAKGEGSASSIKLTVNGNISSVGKNSTAVLAQSLDKHGIGGNIDIVLNAGQKIESGKGGSSVKIDGGKDNTLTNLGTIEVANGIQEFAVFGTTGNDNIINNGTIRGVIDLGSGSNSFVNEKDAIFLTGNKISLGGSGNNINNKGIIHVGGEGYASDVVIDGGLEQSSRGISNIELDYKTNVMDNVKTSGDIELHGELNLKLLNRNLIRPGKNVYTIYASDTSLEAENLNIKKTDTVVTSYAVVANSKDMVVTNNVDFKPSFLEGNEKYLGAYLNKVQKAGSSEDIKDTIKSLVDTRESSTYKDKLEQLNAGLYVHQKWQTLNGLRDFSNNLFDVSSFDRNAGIRGSVNTFDYSRDRRSNFPDVSYRGSRIASHIQFQPYQDVSWGVGFGLGSSSGSGNTASWSYQSNSVDVGLYYHKQWTPHFDIGLKGVYRKSRYDNKRSINVSSAVDLRGNNELDGILGSVELLYGRRCWVLCYHLWFSSGLGLELGNVSGAKVVETGSKGEGLKVNNNSSRYAALTQKIDVRIRRQFLETFLVEPFIRLEAREYIVVGASGGEGLSIQGSLTGAPDNAGSFATFYPLNNYGAKVSVGLDLYHVSGLKLRSFLNLGHFEDSGEQTFGLDLDYRF